MNAKVQVMPCVQWNLQRHEWIARHVLWDRSGQVFFDRAVGLAEAVNRSGVAKLFAENVGKNLSAEAIRAAFEDAFGSGTGGRVTVSPVMDMAITARSQC